MGVFAFKVGSGMGGNGDGEQKMKRKLFQNRKFVLVRFLSTLHKLDSFEKRTTAEKNISTIASGQAFRVLF